MRIIYKNPDNSIAIIIPTVGALAKYGIDAIAKKDTPAGRPFWIVPASSIPNDRSQRDAWELDGSEGEPSGYGSSSSLFEEVA